MTGFAQRFIEQGIQQGIKRGLEQGLEAECRMLLGLVRKRFGADTAARSAPLLEQIADPEALEELAEALLDSADAAAWLAAVARVAE